LRNLVLDCHAHLLCRWARNDEEVKFPLDLFSTFPYDNNKGGLNCFPSSSLAERVSSAQT
ncbi:MAG: hypothetical protein ACPLPS_08710, partial [bacterium]